MRRILALLGCCFCLTPWTHADEYINPDGRPLSTLGGLIFMRQGDTTISSIGGGIFPRKVTVTQATPAGPVVTRFTLPSAFLGQFEFPPCSKAPGLLQVTLPDRHGLIYIEDELVRMTGTARQLQSPPLPVGKDIPLRVRAAFKVGDNLLIEDKQVAVRTGQITTVTFDGSRAVSVPLPRNEPELPFPRKLPE